MVTALGVATALLPAQWVATILLMNDEQATVLDALDARVALIVAVAVAVAVAAASALVPVVATALHPACEPGGLPCRGRAARPRPAELIGSALLALSRATQAMSDGDPAPKPLPGETVSSSRRRRVILWALLPVLTVGCGVAAYLLAGWDAVVGVALTIAFIALLYILPELGRIGRTLRALPDDNDQAPSDSRAEEDR
ncbi:MULTISPECIES: hypothetical protein [unclassified Microbacterium]|uniref:hypothetical protein n=1 Tax=unclassified Microbacterium TaxID=2609290 RepID=UPI0034401716